MLNFRKETDTAPYGETWRATLANGRNAITLSVRRWFDETDRFYVQVTIVNHDTDTIGTAYRNTVIGSLEDAKDHLRELVLDMLLVRSEAIMADRIFQGLPLDS